MRFDDVKELLETALGVRVDEYWKAFLLGSDPRFYKVIDQPYGPKWKGVFVEEDTGAVDLHAVTCGDCGEPMDTHGCPNGTSGAAPTTVVVRSTGPRKKATDHPTCAHCGGRIHWNNGAAIVNFECMYRQYLVEQGLIADPSARLPVFTAEAWVEMAPWIENKIGAGDFQYGNMAASAGGGTYSALKPKAPPRTKLTDEEKKERKAEAAARRKAAKSITEVAEEVSPTTEEDGEMIAGSEPFGDTEADQEVEETPAPVTRSRKRKTAAEAPQAEDGPTDIETRRAERRDQRRKKLAATQAR